MVNTRILTIVGVAALAAVAIFGWARKVEVAPQSLIDPAYQSNPSAVSVEPSYASRPAVRTVRQRAAAPVHYADQAPARRVVVRERPLKNSVAIVAGSAGVGAAIGALAGGGKGAAIGALAGGGGGFVYDRITHKKKVEVE